MSKQIFDQDRPRSTMAQRLDEAFAGCDEWTVIAAPRPPPAAPASSTVRRCCELRKPKPSSPPVRTHRRSSPRGSKGARNGPFGGAAVPATKTPRREHRFRARRVLEMMPMKSRRSSRLALVALLAAAVCAAGASAAHAPHAGSLDPSFAKDGVATRDLGSEPSRGGAKRVIATPDGGSLVLTVNDAVARFGPDGHLDTSFGEGGFLTGDIYAAQAMAIGPGGRIVTTGRRRTADSAQRFTEVHRYLPDGRPDTSFGGDGAASFPVPRATGWGEGVVVEPSGKVIVLSRTTRLRSSAVSAVRLTARGELDDSYGDGGYAFAEAGASFDEFIGDPIRPRVYTLRDRNLTIALTDKRELLILRLDPNGKPDQSFGSGGRIVSKAFTEPITALAIDPTGRMILSSYYGGVARLLPEGSPDPSFGEAGITHPLERGSLLTVDLAPDGKILVAGDAREPESRSPEFFLLARLDEGGNLDRSFGSGAGFVTRTLSPGSNGEATDLAQLDNGDLLLAGTFTPAGAFTDQSQIGMILYASDGSLVQGFGDGGASIVRPRAQAIDEINEVLAVPDGKTIVVGRGGGGILLARYLRSGRPDPTFGRGGFAPPVAVSGDYFGERATSVVSYAGHRLVVGTHSRSGGGLLRYLPDGSLDPSFGHGGIVRTTPFDGVLDVANARGDLVAVGVSYSGCHILVSRFEADGDLDPGFAGGKGSVTVGKGYGPCERLPEQLAVGRDGSILAGGSWSPPLAVITRDGHRNPEFGRRGGHGIEWWIPDHVRALAVDARGRILVAGGEDKMLALARLTPKGFPDRSFGQAGIEKTRIGYSAEITSLAPRADGSILAGAIVKSCAQRAFCRATAAGVARYLPSGAPDPTFGRNGIWRPHLGVGASLRSLALSRRGVTAGGWVAYPGTSRDLLLVRLRD